MLNLHVLASGSKGNATLIEQTDTHQGFLIDCGICKRDFFERCNGAHFDVANLSAIVFTHEHTDHTKGIGVVLRGLAKMDIHPEVYVNPATYRASKELQSALKDYGYTTMDINGEIDIAGCRVFPFKTSHDAVNPCGYRIEHDGDAIGFMTDTGIVTPTAHDHLQNVRVLALESNHDERMLAACDYPSSTKNRIASAFGHLSNLQAQTELSSLLSDRLQDVIAMHISENSNTFDLPCDGFKHVLTQESHPARVQNGFPRSLVSVTCANQ